MPSCMNRLLSLPHVDCFACSLFSFYHQALFCVFLKHPTETNLFSSDHVVVQLLCIQHHFEVCSVIIGNWGPHLIIVPTSVMLNWEMELKRWCPGFKILTYFGSQKERKLKRQVTISHSAYLICAITVMLTNPSLCFFYSLRVGQSLMLSMCASLRTSWCSRITKLSDASLGGT